jgi:hypothetical protein
MSQPLVMVPYVRLQPHVELMLACSDFNAVLEDTSASSDAYWKVLAEWWSEGNTFIVLEGDKHPAPGLLQELWDCPMPWCTVATPMRGTDEPAPYPSLSCTKFSAELIARRPTLLDDVGELDLGFGEKEWSRLDMGIAAGLEPIIGCHYHDGVVEHLHAA